MKGDSLQFRLVRDDDDGKARLIVTSNDVEATFFEGDHRDHGDECEHCEEEASEELIAFERGRDVGRKQCIEAVAKWFEFGGCARWPISDGIRAAADEILKECEADGD